MLTAKYKRSAGLEAFYFQFADKFVNIQFFQIQHFNPHYAYTIIAFVLTFINQIHFR
jgi:hypothetical protein